jgi:hypothetical protein
MKPEKKTTATMNTTPATIPTQAAAAVSLDRRGGSAACGGAVGACDGGGAAATGPVAGSDEDVVVSLMATIMQTVLMCQSCFAYESAVSGRRLISTTLITVLSGSDGQKRYQGLNGLTANWITRYGVPPRGMVFHWLTNTLSSSSVEPGEM